MKSAKGSVSSKDSSEGHLNLTDRRRDKSHRGSSPSVKERKEHKSTHKTSPTYSRDTKVKQEDPADTRAAEHSSTTKLNRKAQAKSNLPDEFRTLRDFIEDKHKMVEQLFITIRGEALKQMLPSTLKSCSLEELKMMCLEQLRLMSNNKIIYILSGKDPASYTDSEVEELQEVKQERQEPEEKGQNANVRGTSKRKSEETGDVPQAICEAKKHSFKRIVTEDANKTSSVSSPAISETKSDADGDALELCATQKEIDSLIQEEILHQIPAVAKGEIKPEKVSPTELEILELEMRARAIRSLLKAQGIVSSDDEHEESRKLEGGSCPDAEEKADQGRKVKGKQQSDFEERIQLQKSAEDQNRAWEKKEFFCQQSKKN